MRARAKTDLSSHSKHRAGYAGHLIFKEAALKNLILIAALAALPQMAQAGALPDDTYVTEKLVAAQVGDILRKKCPKAEARMFVVMSEMLSLQNHAKSNGHDDATIRAFLKNPDQKARIRALAESYLETAGAVEGDEASFCAVARAEVAANTTAGQLLKVAN